MQTKLHLAPPTARLALLLALLSTLNLQLPALFAQGTAFTYQGRLNTNGVPFSGSAEFQFTIWDDVSAGSAVATNNPASLIAPVTNGLFAVTLDFGSNPFNGQPRFLQTDVRTTIGPFTSLTPRQPLTATPYALRALTLTTNGLAGTYGNAVAFNNPGNNFVGSFAGDGSGMTNVNAITIGGLAPTIFWKTNGNAGANPANGAFLGTTDNLPLELKVNNLRSLRLEPTANDLNHSNMVNLIAGSPVNSVAAGVYGATIAGGGGVNEPNTVAADSGTIGGGADNAVELNSPQSTIAGGFGNSVSNSFASSIGGGDGNQIIAGANSGNSVIAGGLENLIGFSSFSINIGPPSGVHFIGGGLQNLIGPGISYSVIGGGSYNAVTAGNATIGGGNGNSAQALGATVPGGYGNTAGGLYSFAAGQHAKAMNAGTFVWADSQNANFTSTGSNQFLLRASGGVGVNTTNPVADLHVNGSVLIQGPVVTPVATSSSNLLNILVGGTSFIATNGSANGISFYESASQKAMSLGYDGSGSSTANALRIYGSTDIPLFTFQNGGNMGVGTATPATLLHVREAADSEISIESSDTNGHRWTLQSSRVNGSATDASFQIVDRTSGGSRFFIGTNGFVGIGTSTPTNKLHVAGGVSATVFITTSDRNAKENFAPVSPLDVLDKLAALPITRWTFKEMPGQLHLGPMAQDFHSAFGLGAGDTGIATVDADGVALAAIQGLNQKVEARTEKDEGRMQKLEAENAGLKQRLDVLEKIILSQESH